MSKFKIGDRVVLRDIEDLYHFGLAVGMTGTILEDYEFPFVKFDNFTKGNRGDGLSDRNDCWACYEGRLKLLDNKEE